MSKLIGGRLHHFFHPSCEHNRTGLSAMRHSILQCKPTDVLTGEKKRKKILSTAQHGSGEPPSISQLRLRLLVDLAHRLLLPARHPEVRLCRDFSHTAEIHAQKSYTLAHYQINSLQTPARTNIVLDPGSRMVSEGGILFIQSNRFISAPTQNDTTSQAEINERGWSPHPH